ncbi:MAG: acyl-CoA thioesterase [Gammaproteobacteria bacterium]|nr:acyl-CoA thioesterase [Gammaproteobacteria bacterium]
MAHKHPLFEARPRHFPIHVNEHVRWGDLDAFGHVNNTIYFQWFESARMEFLQRTGFMDLMHDRNIGPILAHTECFFRRPLGHPCELLVATRSGDVDARRFAMEYGIFERTDEMPLAACGTGIVVCYDYNERCKAQIPEPLRQRLLELGSSDHDH